MDDGITIRLATKEDLAKLAEIYQRAFNGADPNKYWSLESARALMEYLYAGHPDLFFIATINDRLTGGIVTNIKPWRDGNRFQDPVFFVDPEVQRKGIGKLLFMKLLEAAIDKYNVITFEAITFAGDAFPLTWYKKLGIFVDEGAVLIKGDCKKTLKALSSSS